MGHYTVVKKNEVDLYALNLRTHQDLSNEQKPTHPTNKNQVANNVRSHLCEKQNQTTSTGCLVLYKT